MNLEIQQIVATEEYATLRYTVHGTHLRDFHGIPPSGAPITMPALGLVRVKDGLLAEGWYVFDSGMLIMQSPKRTCEWRIVGSRRWKNAASAGADCERREAPGSLTSASSTTST
jgi:SnoaL-like polyketide cyclase